jgi:murein DD-endopeptidase MepM/ murein hydrolase activator NlpD
MELNGMKRRRAASTGTELIERIARARVLVATAAVFIFGFSFIASGQPSAGLIGAVSQGSADMGMLQDGAGMAEMDPMTAIAPPPDEGLYYTVYQVAKGDTISEIASNFGVTTDSIVTFNGITNARTLSIGKFLKVPNLNGILYSAKDGDTVDALATSYDISADRIKDINHLDEEPLTAGIRIFLPDARLSSWALREISGDLFTWPIRGWITSWYGWRNDPFTGARTFHTGIDIGSSPGVPVHAAMEGVVRATGYSTTSGNYVVIAHHSGYSSLYAHLERTDVKPGRTVSTATVIGAVGSTGYSTGPHLHFTVSKYGRTLNPMTVLR